MHFEVLLGIFDELGLSQKEILFLRSLLKYQKLSLVKLMETTKLTKATIYRVFRALEQKGLVHSDQKKRGQIVALCSASELLAYATRRQRAVRKVELKIRDRLEEIKTFLKNPVSLPEVQRLYGKEGYLEIIEETLETPESEILYFGDLDDMHRVITAEYDYSSYMPRRIKKNNYLRMLVGKTKEMISVQSEDHKRLRETRFIHDPKLITASFMIFGENVYFLSHSDEAVAVKISSTSISSMFRNIFEHYWKLAEKS